MTINESQRQFKQVGVYLPTSEFSHGQLYVAVLRVTSREGLKILITDEDGEETNMTSVIALYQLFFRCSNLIYVTLLYFGHKLFIKF